MNQVQQQQMMMANQPMLQQTQQQVQDAKPAALANQELIDQASQMHMTSLQQRVLQHVILPSHPTHPPQNQSPQAKTN
eukprot:790078-Ditylum_brightwellii.AAC.1